jgi:hypothetical protein
MRALAQLPRTWINGAKHTQPRIRVAIDRAGRCAGGNGARPADSQCSILALSMRKVAEGVSSNHALYCTEKRPNSQNP